MVDIRIITGWTFFIAICIAIYFGGWFLGIFIGILLLFGMRELLQMMHSKDLFPSVVTAYLGSITFVTLACFNQSKYFHIVATFLVICAFLAILRRGKDARIKDIGATLICVLYGGFLPSHFLFLRNMETGSFDVYGHHPSLALGYVILMVLCITITDVAAYFAGKKFGRHKLWEEISPKKTIEGSIAGVLAAIFFAIISGAWLNMALWQSITAGILITVFAQLGDLVESMMKRDAGAKDASDILPGHGGFLDRADSYIFTVAIAYYFFYYFVEHPIF